MTFVPGTQLPKRGYIVDDIACIFLFKTDSKVGLMDYFVSNPTKDPTERKEAFDLGMKHMFREAKDMGIEVLTAYSSLPNVIAYAELCGGLTDMTPHFRVRVKI